MDEIRQQKRIEILNQIWIHCAHERISIETLAERTGMRENSIVNAFAGKYSIGIDHLIKLAEAAECKIVIESIKNLEK